MAAIRSSLQLQGVDHLHICGVVLNLLRALCQFRDLPGCELVRFVDPSFANNGAFLHQPRQAKPTDVISHSYAGYFAGALWFTHLCDSVCRQHECFFVGSWLSFFRSSGLCILIIWRIHQKSSGNTARASLCLLRPGLCASRNHRCSYALQCATQ